MEIEITNHCNLDCKHCYIIEKNTATMPLETINILMNTAKKYKVKDITITGGEPLLHPSFDKIKKPKHYKGLLGLQTNGTFINKKNVEILKKFDYVQLSFDWDSKIRKQKNSEIIQKAKMIQKMGIRTYFLCTLSKNNVKNIKKILAVSKKNKIGLNFNRLIPIGKAVKLKKFVLSPAEFVKLIKDIKKKEKTVRITDPLTVFIDKEKQKIGFQRIVGGCVAGISTCYITANGDVFPCPLVRVKAGNIKDNPLKKIWEKSKLFSLLRNRDNFEKCKDCKYKNACGGCRASALAFGNLFGDDKQCPYCKEIEITPIKNVEIREASRVIKKSVSSMKEYSKKQLYALNLTNTPKAIELKRKTREIFLAKQKKNILGVIGLETNEIKGLYVLPEFQNNGIGSSLLKAMEKLAMSKGFEKIIVYSSLNAISFYSKQGFVGIKEIFKNIQGVSIKMFLMEKALVKKEII